MIIKPSKLSVLALAVLLAACGNSDEKDNNPNGTPNGEPNNGTPNSEPNNGEPNSEPNNGEPNSEPNNNPGNCDDVANACSTPGSACAGNSAVVCSADANGCLVETTTDCGASAQQCQAGGCVSVDPCNDDPRCADVAPGESVCDGDELVTCNADAEGCLVATTQDCVAAGGTCDTDINACVVACTDAPECDGLADGDAACLDGATTVSCALNAAGCLEATTVACAVGETCDDSGDAPACVGACPEAIQVLSCADAGMTITGDTVNLPDNFQSYTCYNSNYTGQDALYTFVNPTNAEVSIEITTIGAPSVDAFVTTGGICGDPTLTCSAYEYIYTGSDVIEFGAAANEPYFVTLEPFSPKDGTFEYGLTITCVDVVCGDGTIAGGEQCDDGNADDGDGCSSTCQVEDNFECDNAQPTTCVEIVCGDGIIAGDEQCDDGNADDGDGCSSACEVEDNFECDNAEPTVCVEIVCGDGIILADEQCDDGNADDGDGCSSACEIEDNFECDDAEPTVCVEIVCGDGVIVGPEACDDGNTADGDGCSATCDVEPGYDCTSGTCIPFPNLGTFAAGEPIPEQTNTTGLTAGQSNSYVITFSETLTLRVIATAATSDGDLDVYIYDDTGAQVTRGYAAGDEDFSTVLEAGTYTIEARAFSAVTGYTLSLSTEAIPSYAGGDVIPDTVGQLTAGSKFTKVVTFTDDVTLDASVSSVGGDPELEILTAGGSRIVRSALSGPDEVLGLVLPAGTYSIIVEAYTFGGDLDPYTLTLSTTALSTVDLGTVGVGGTIADQTGTLAADSADYYVVTFSEEVTATVMLSGNTTGETSVWFLNAAFDLYGSQTVGDETLTETFPPGRYLISVESDDADVDAYTLSFSL